MGIQMIDDYLGHKMSPGVLDEYGNPAPIVRSWDFTEVCGAGVSGVVVNYAVARDGLYGQVVHETGPKKNYKKAHWLLDNLNASALVQGNGFREMAQRVGLEPCTLARMVLSFRPEVANGTVVARRRA